jgi:hypothetical protein
LNDLGGGSACTSHTTFKFSLRYAPTITILSVMQTGASGKRFFGSKRREKKVFEKKFQLQVAT